jgi:hypothetical protein
MRALGTASRMWSDNMSSKFTDSLVNMLLYSQITMCQDEEYIHYEKAPFSWHEGARNNLVETMLGDWILMLDTDHVFAPDLLERLLRIRAKYKAPVVSGIYCYKFPPHAPVVNMWDADGRVAPLLDWDRKAEVLEVGCVGAGCLLIERSVFNRLSKAYPGVGPFTIIPGLSEDYSFCKRCHDQGIPITLAPQIESHHIITHVTSIKDYQPPVGLKSVTTSDGVIL